MTQRQDIVSIVTVVYNGKHFIEKTINSVLSQTYPYIEYIIIDGGSTDGTVDIIKKHEHKISYWSSEPDKGVYDAMNKGIKKATGRWINFMNAGDYFFSPETLQHFFCTDINIDAYDAVYGDAEFRIKKIAYISPSGDKVDSNGFMPFSHQAVFVKTDIAKATLFDLRYRITADTAFFLQLVQEGKIMCRIPVTVCSYDALQGLSVQNEIKRTEELINMQVALNGADKNNAYFRKQMCMARIKQGIRKIIPSSIWIMLREHNAKKKGGYKITGQSND